MIAESAALPTENVESCAHENVFPLIEKRVHSYPIYTKDSIYTT